MNLRVKNILNAVKLILDSVFKMEYVHCVQNAQRGVSVYEATGIPLGEKVRISFRHTLNGLKKEEYSSIVSKDEWKKIKTQIEYGSGSGRLGLSHHVEWK